MKKILQKLDIHNRKDFFDFVIQFIKFGLVGLSNTVITLIIYYIFVFIDKDLYIIGNTVGWILSVINAFYWNNRYVFKNQESHILKRLLKTYLTYGLSFLVSTGIIFVCVDILSISENIAPLISLVVTIPLNFIISKFWAYK